MTYLSDRVAISNVSFDAASVLTISSRHAFMSAAALLESYFHVPKEPQRRAALDYSSCPSG